MDEQHREISLRELIANICERPVMYIGSATFLHVAIFVDGFTVGRGGTDLATLHRFREWVAYLYWRRLRMPQNYAWYSYIGRDRTDAEAISALAALFERFLKSEQVDSNSTTNSPDGSPPAILDGANVVYYGTLRPDTVHYIPQGEKVSLPRFAIAQYNPESVYIFYCDEDWRVLSDWDYDSVDEAVEYIKGLDHVEFLAIPQSV